MGNDTIRSAKILKGIDAIRHYIDPRNPISRDRFKEFLRLGMPANLIGSVWYAHGDNIDAWFMQLTRKDCSKTPEGVIDNAE
jgi:hypothetical protein